MIPFLHVIGPLVETLSNRHVLHGESVGNSRSSTNSRANSVKIVGLGLYQKSSDSAVIILHKLKSM